MAYVYLHRKETDNEVFYVGKGSHKNRAYRNDGRNEHWHRVVNKYGKTVEIFKDNIEENLAFYLEKFLILVYGKENLTNKTDGGEGACGFKHSKEECENRRLRKLGVSRQDVTGDRSIFNRYPYLLDRMYGNSNPMKSKEVAEKNAAAKRGKKYPKISEAQKGIPKPWNLGAKHFNAISVVCIETGTIFTYINEAIDWLVSLGKTKATHSPITKCCKGTQKSAYGYTWKYFES